MPERVRPEPQTPPPRCGAQDLPREQRLCNAIKYLRSNITQQSPELPSETFAATAGWSRATRNPGGPKGFVLSCCVPWSRQAWACLPPAPKRGSWVLPQPLQRFVVESHCPAPARRPLAGWMPYPNGSKGEKPASPARPPSCQPRTSASQSPAGELLTPGALGDGRTDGWMEDSREPGRPPALPESSGAFLCPPRRGAAHPGISELSLRLFVAFTWRDAEMDPNGLAPGGPETGVNPCRPACVAFRDGHQELSPFFKGLVWPESGKMLGVCPPHGPVGKGPVLLAEQLPRRRAAAGSVKPFPTLPGRCETPQPVAARGALVLGVRSGTAGSTLPGDGGPRVAPLPAASGPTCLAGAGSLSRRVARRVLEGGGFRSTARIFCAVVLHLVGLWKAAGVLLGGLCYCSRTSPVFIPGFKLLLLSPHFPSKFCRAGDGMASSLSIQVGLLLSAAFWERLEWAKRGLAQAMQRILGCWELISCPAGSLAKKPIAAVRSPRRVLQALGGARPSLPSIREKLSRWM